MTKVRLKQVFKYLHFTVKHLFPDKGDVAFITYEKGEAEAKIRFKVEDFAKPIAEKWTEKVDIKDHKVDCKLMEVIIIFISLKLLQSNVVFDLPEVLLFN